jgi:uncharacterized protein DUF4252
MQLRIAAAVFGLIASLGWELSSAQNPVLTLPAFTGLGSRAVESVDISLGSLPLIAASLMDGHDPASADLKSALSSLRALYIRHYSFESDFAYSKADIDSVRAQLSGAGWKPVAQIHDRNKSEDVDVFLAFEKDKITGLAFVASEPREFTIINAVGTLDLKQAEVLRHHFEHSGDAGGIREMARF